MNQTHSLTKKQRERLEEIGQRDSPGQARVTGWDRVNHGPIVKFAQGATVVVTRSGGIQPLT